MMTARLGYALIALAGCVDAIGLLEIGAFVSFMSGNSTHAAVDLVTGSPQKAILAFTIILLFVTGAFAGESIALRARTRGRIIILVTIAILLAFAPLLAHRAPLVRIAPVVLAMGISNAAVRRIGPVSASLTYVTGTLVHLAEELAAASLGGESAWRIHAFMWTCMMAGATAGALLFTRFHFGALFFASAYAAVLAVASGNDGHSSS